MRLYLGSFACLLALSAAPALLAQQAPAEPPQRDPAAVALLTKSLVAMSRGLPISDVTLQGAARRIAGSDDETGTAVLKAMATGEARVDLIFPSGQRSEVRTNPETGRGKWSGTDTEPHPIYVHNLAADSAWFFPLLTVARHISSEAYAISFVGRETRHDQSVLHFTVSQQFSNLPRETAKLMQRLSRMEIYLDSSTLLPFALTFNVHPDQDLLLDIPVEVLFSDYRPLNGIQLPFRVQKYLNNSLVLDLQFQTATFNSGLRASDFAVD